MTQQVFTIGYQGQKIEEFVEYLDSKNIDLVIDVRLTPLSRKKGFSKTALKNSLESVGIDYIHRKEFGNPKEFRKKAKSIDHCLKLYKKHMGKQSSEIWIELKAELENRRAALLCFEKHDHECHRSIVAQGLLEKELVEEVVNL